MKFTIRPGHSSQRVGGFAVTAESAREALDHVKNMRASGLLDVHILDEHEQRYDLSELERITAQSEENIVS